MTPYDMQAIYTIIGMALFVSTFPIEQFLNNCEDKSIWVCIGFIGLVVFCVAVWPVYLGYLFFAWVDRKLTNVEGG